jgi:pantetheine-phosphate adenylyltransferase
MGRPRRCRTDHRHAARAARRRPPGETAPAKRRELDMSGNARRDYRGLVMDPARGDLIGKHAVYPGIFDPITPGHLAVIERARKLFARVTVLIAVNSAKDPSSTQLQRAERARPQFPAHWDNVSVTAWAGLTVDFCRGHGVDVIVRGIRNRADLDHESRLAAMNYTAGFTTVLLPAEATLAGISSTILRELHNPARCLVPPDA